MLSVNIMVEMPSFTCVYLSVHFDRVNDVCFCTINNYDAILAQYEIDRATVRFHCQNYK